MLASLILPYCCYFIFFTAFGVEDEGIELGAVIPWLVFIEDDGLIDWPVSERGFTEKRTTSSEVPPS